MAARSSKFRHVFGQPNKKEKCFDNVRVSNSAWDTNYISLNPLFMAVNCRVGGGGAFSVFKNDQYGKQAEPYPTFSGHAGPVLDTAWNPFNDHIIASCAEDAKVMIWKIPEDGPPTCMDEVGDFDMNTPVVTLDGHQRKVGHVEFNPVAENVLASTSADLSVRIWDIEAGKSLFSFDGVHGEIIQGISWNANGSQFATVCRDKKIRVFDARSGKCIQEGSSHQGVKGSRILWLGEHDRIATTGFTRTSDRQLFLWDSSDLSKPLQEINVDTSAGVLMPHYDADVGVLYLAGRGDGNIRYYEYDSDSFHYLNSYSSPDPQRGMGWMPKRGCNISENEIDRCLKVVANGTIEPISFTVPRKSDLFQADIFPDTPGGEPALSSQEWLEGKVALPIKVSLEKGFVPVVKEFVSKQEPKPAAAPAEKLTAADKDARIKELEARVKELEAQLEKASL